MNQEWFVPRYGTFEVSPLSDPRFVIKTLLSALEPNIHCLTVNDSY